MSDTLQFHERCARPVRSLYWVRINLANKMRADCVYADPDQPLPDWTDDFLKRLDINE